MILYCISYSRDIRDTVQDYLIARRQAHYLELREWNAAVKLVVDAQVVRVYAPICLPMTHIDYVTATHSE